MKVITKRELIQTVLERWLEQYPDKDSTEPKHRKITDKLRKLDFNTISPEEVEKIIGNRSWTNNICYHCGKDHEILMEFKSHNDDECGVDVCLDCLELSWVQLEYLTRTMRKLKTGIKSQIIRNPSLRKKNNVRTSIKK